MENQNQPSLVNEETKKTRKTLDQYLGINGLCAIALVGVIFGGVLRAIGVAAGISATYYLIKKRKELKTGQKWTGWILVAIWFVLFGVVSGSFHN